MAVIRQRAQVFNQPIGVVRASSGGVQVGEAISRFADNITQMTYEVAAEDAQKRGQEAGLARASSDIAALDPETNKPVAYQPPAKFGRIAADAYQDIVNQRFEGSVLQEMQNKGADLAKSSANSSQYRDRMSAYIQSMYEAGGENTSYQRYIEEKGAEYVQKTYGALRQKEAAAARAAMKRQARLASVEQTLEIQRRLATGQFNPELQGMIAALQSDAVTRYAAGAGNITEVKEAYEMSRGFEAMAANRNLASTYYDMGEAEQSAIQAALRDPANIDTIIADPTVRGLVLKSLEGKSSGAEIVSALTATEKSLTDAALKRDQDFLEQNPVSPMMTAAGVKAKYRGQSPELISQAMEDLFLLNTADMSEVQADAILNELQKPKSAIQISELPSGVQDIVMSLSEGDRGDLVENLKARKSALGATETNALNSALTVTASATESMVAAKDPDSLFALHEKASEAASEISDPEKRISKQAAIDALFSEQLRKLVSSEGISVDEMSDIRDAISLNKGEYSGSKEGEAFFNAMRRAYEIAPATTAAKLGSILEAKTRMTNDQINASLLSSATTKAKSGQPLSKTEVNALEEKFYSDRAPTPQELAKDAGFRSRASQNIILPSELASIEQGLSSGDSNTQIVAFDLFRQLTSVKQGVGGATQNRDFLRGRMDEETYNRAQSAIRVSSLRPTILPNEALAAVMNFEGNLTTVIRDGLDIKEIKQVFTDFKLPSMDNKTQQEFLSVLRFSAANGIKINEDTLKDVVKEFEKGLVEDERILAPNIGGKTHYALDIVFDEKEQGAIFKDIVSKFEQDPEFSEYLNTGIVGGFAEVIASTYLYGGTEGEARSRVLFNELADYVKLEPIMETWANNKKGNRSYILKMKSSFGYVTPMPNGFPIIISESEYAEPEVDDPINPTFRQKNLLTAAANSGNAVATAKEGLKYLRMLEHLDLNTLEEVRKIEEYGINTLTDEQINAILRGEE
jgi:hypothetical protein